MGYLGQTIIKRVYIYQQDFSRLKAVIYWHWAQDASGNEKIKCLHIKGKSNSNMGNFAGTDMMKDGNYKPLMQGLGEVGYIIVPLLSYVTEWNVSDVMKGNPIVKRFADKEYAIGRNSNRDQDDIKIQISEKVEEYVKSGMNEKEARKKAKKELKIDKTDSGAKSCIHYIREALLEEGKSGHDLAKSEGIKKSNFVIISINTAKRIVKYANNNESNAIINEFKSRPPILQITEESFAEEKNWNPTVGSRPSSPDPELSHLPKLETKNSNHARPSSEPKGFPNHRPHPKVGFAPIKSSGNGNRAGATPKIVKPKVNKNKGLPKI